MQADDRSGSGQLRELAPSGPLEQDIRPLSPYPWWEDSRAGRSVTTDRPGPPPGLWGADGWPAGAAFGDAAPARVRAGPGAGGMLEGEGTTVARFGLDIGTSGTVAYDPDGGLLLEEPSVMLTMPRGGTSIGREAADLVDRLPTATPAVRPVSAGVVTDLDAARRYVRAVLHRMLPRPWQRVRTTAVVAVPAGASALERRALVEAAEEAGITHVTALAAPVAAALGCGVDPLDRRVHMVADIGAGTSEIMAVCSGEVLSVRSGQVAGDALAGALRTHLRDEYQASVSPAAAEDLVQTASAAPDESEVTVSGRDIDRGRPRTVQLRAAELHAVLAPLVTATADALARCLDDLPARAVEDLAADGVLLVGGAAGVRGLRSGLETGLGLPVKPVENPTTCVAEGAARSLRLPAVHDAFGLR